MNIPQWFNHHLTYRRASGAAIICPSCGSHRADLDAIYTAAPSDGILCSECYQWISPPYCVECGETDCQCPATQAKEDAA